MGSSSSKALALSVAAGLSVGLAACENKEAPKQKAAATSASVMVAAESADKDCCIGKNECKGKGGCAVPESHACAGQNECKGKGGCNMHCPK